MSEDGSILAFGLLIFYVYELLVSRCDDAVIKVIYLKNIM